MVLTLVANNMEGSFGLLSTLTLLGTAHGIFLALALLNTQSGNKKAHRILALFTFLFAIDLGEEFLYQVGFFESAPHLLQILAPLDLLYGPVLYLYVTQLTRHDGLKITFWHFLPAIGAILLLCPFYWYLDGPEKLLLTDSLRKGGGVDSQSTSLALLGITTFALLTIVQIGFYLIVSIKRLVSHFSSIKDNFSDIVKINLLWLRNLLLGLTLIYLFYLADQFYPDLMGVNFLGDSVTVLAVILIYTMGYLGLKQPKIFTLALDSQESQAKYLRSGLDKDSSGVFLDELTAYMEDSKPHLQGGLTLPELAQQLGISPNYLSQVINEQHNVNFHDFVNKHRVEEAKRLMRSSNKKNTNILNIAFDSGFNSKSAFYSAFKKVTAMTPTQYNKSL